MNTLTDSEIRRVRSFRDLLAWQRGMELAVETYRLTCRLPATERFGLQVQTRRAAVSISANIAEGVGRGTTRDFVRFLSIANGSLKELETHLALGLRLHLYGPDEAREVFRLVEEVGKLLGGLIRSLRRREPRTR